MARDKDPFDLTGQPAEQQLDVPAVTNPAAETASSAERYAPGRGWSLPQTLLRIGRPHGRLAEFGCRLVSSYWLRCRCCLWEPTDTCSLCSRRMST